MKSSCPHCGQHFDVDEADVGKEADCTNCGKRFTLQPTVAPTAPAQQPPPSSETGEMLDSEAFDETDPETGAALQGNHAEIDKIVRRYLRPGDDETVRRALEVVILDRKASTSYLQRRLGIGYNRAAEIMDLMEERGIVGPSSGSGNKREILVPYPQENLPSSVCSFCGGEIVSGVKKCRHCGEWLDAASKPKNPVVFVLLGIFCGLWGAHRFYGNEGGDTGRKDIADVCGVAHFLITGAALLCLWGSKDVVIIGCILLGINLFSIMIELIFCEEHVGLRKG